MANKKSTKNKMGRNITTLVVLLIIAFFKSPIMNGSGDFDESTLVNENELISRYIDVGQADSELISLGDQDMLIDAGNNDDFPIIKKQLENIDDLEYIILTHPHEDHIGSADDVINSKWVNSDTIIIMPEKTHTTKTYRDVISAIKENNLSITVPSVGDVYKLGDAEFIILAPQDGVNYADNLNNWSVGIKLKYGDTSFVYCGDAEAESEEAMIGTGISLDADVYKANHHGSRTSNTDAFLDAISPEYAVISCEEGNDYGHPHQEVLDAFAERGIEVYRTDELGTIVFKSDGVTVECLNK